MIPLLLLLLVTPQTEDCTIHYYVRLTYVDRVSVPGEPLQLTARDVMIGPLTPERAIAEAKRDDLMRNGWRMPRLLPGDPETSAELRIAPGAFLTNSVQTACCFIDPTYCVEIPYR